MKDCFANFLPSAQKQSVPNLQQKRWIAWCQVVLIGSEIDHDTPLEESKKAQIKIATLEKKIDKTKEYLAKYQHQSTSIMGLEKPLFRLKNPGIISIQLGFLMVILFSLLTRDKRAENLWEELYVRQNTGLHVEDVSH